MAADKLNIESFGEIIDKFLTDSEILLQIRMPEGTMEPEIKSNVMAGTIEFYILLHAMEANILKMFDELGGADTFDTPGFLDGILELVRNDILEAVSKGEHHE